MPLSENLEFHEQSWLRYQDRIIDGQTPYREKLEYLERQDHHAERYCLFQGNEILNHINLKILPGERLGI